jgi:PAS domain S-box-containing protein
MGGDFLEIADSAPAMIWLSDADNGGIWFNRRWLQYTGRKAKQELGSGWTEGMHPEDMERCQAVYSKACKACSPFEIEFRLRQADGSYGWIADTGAPRLGPMGELTGYMRFCWNITRRKQAEQALQESAQHTQAILDNALDGIVTIDSRGIVQSFNRAATDIFGYEASEVIGRNVNMLMPEPYRSQHDRYLENYQATGVPRIIGIGREVEGRRKDGSSFPMDLAVSQTTHKEKPMFVGLVRDITERKRIEKMKSEFVSTVSHELRTPLTSISGALGLLAGKALGELPAQARQMVEIAHKNSTRLSHLINDLLDMEKLAAGKISMDMQVQPLMPLVEQSLETMRSYAEQFQVGFRFVERADQALVKVDDVRLQQILTNFLSNAVKFNPKNAEVDVAVRCGKDSVRVEVTDRGPGIPDSFRDRIFQRFSQADASDARQSSGSGLGLAISRELAERMGGSVGFASQEGKGACFHLELPIVEDAADEQEKPYSGHAAPCVLVVEDEPDIARLLKITLERGGYDVDIALDGEQALSLLARNAYAAITLDLLLPDHSGADLVQRIRGRRETENLPIVVISAHTEQGKLSIDSEFAAIDWLDKPVDEARLIAAIRRSLNSSSDGRPRVLHVEDDGDLHKIVCAVGNTEAKFDAARSLAEAREKLNQSRYSMILLDLKLPDGSGWELLPQLQGLDPEPPVLVLSAEELDIEQKAMVQAALVKSHTSSQDFLNTLKRLVAVDAGTEAN